MKSNRNITPSIIGQKQIFIQFKTVASTAPSSSDIFSASTRIKDFFDHANRVLNSLPVPSPKKNQNARSSRSGSDFRKINNIWKLMKPPVSKSEHNEDFDSIMRRYIKNINQALDIVPQLSKKENDIRSALLSNTIRLIAPCDTETAIKCINISDEIEQSQLYNTFIITIKERIHDFIQSKPHYEIMLKFLDHELDLFKTITNLELKKSFLVDLYFIFYEVKQPIFVVKAIDYYLNLIFSVQFKSDTDNVESKKCVELLLNAYQKFKLQPNSNYFDLYICCVVKKIQTIKSEDIKNKLYQVIAIQSYSYSLESAITLAQLITNSDLKKTLINKLTSKRLPFSS